MLTLQEIIDQIFEISKKYKVCFIEGNTAAGKTTTIQEIAKTSRNCIEEKFHEWSHYLDKSVLNRHYTPLVQFTAVKCNYDILQALLKAESQVFVERSMLATVVYTNVLTDLGIIKNDFILKAIEHEFWNFYLPALNSFEHCYIYLDVEPAECLQRIQERNREGEKQVHIPFLEELDRIHKHYLKKMKNVFYLKNK